MPTTPLGIPYPASTDAPRVWQDMQSLASQVDTLLQGFGQWTSFTPTFSAGVLAQGTGFYKAGWYSQIGKMMFWHWRYEFGATGSPALNAELQWDIGNLPGTPYIDPSPAAPGLTTTLGNWTWRSSTSGLRHYSGTVGIFAVGANTAFLGGAFDGTAHRIRMGATGTPALANSDVIAAAGHYRLA